MSGLTQPSFVKQPENAPSIRRKLDVAHPFLEIEVVQDHPPVKVNQQGVAIYSVTAYAQATVSVRTKIAERQPCANATPSSTVISTALFGDSAIRSMFLRFSKGSVTDVFLDTGRAKWRCHAPLAAGRNGGL